MCNQVFVNNSLRQFDPISLLEMDKVALLKRTDTKFVLNETQLYQLLDKIQNDYSCLEIDNKRLMQYESLYFDSENLHFYHQHHNNRSGRIKVRKRSYVDSDLSFLEIKRKDRKGDTIKKRIKIEGLQNEIAPDELAFLHKAKMPAIDIRPTIMNSFKRFTLVSKKSIERLTVDVGLKFNNGNAFEGKHGGLVVVEVKQPKLSRKSDVMRALKAGRIRPKSISKYCIGIASVNKDVKQNVFKDKFRTINKTIN
ncbi:MAG: polyphosphate polymerase domain-containing protein [Bacteroidia bacterium]